VLFYLSRTPDEKKILVHLTRQVPGSLMKVFILADQKPLLDVIEAFPVGQDKSEKILLYVDQSTTSGPTVELDIPFKFSFYEKEARPPSNGIDFEPYLPLVKALWVYRMNLTKEAIKLMGHDGGRYIIEEYSFWLKFEKENGDSFSMECTPELVAPVYRQGYLNKGGRLIKYLTAYPTCDRFVPHEPEDKSPEALFEFFHEP